MTLSPPAPGCAVMGVGGAPFVEDADRDQPDDDRETTSDASQAGVSANADGPLRRLGQDRSHQVQGCVSGWLAGIRSSGCSVGVMRAARAEKT